MPGKIEYDINMDVQFSPLETIDLQKLVEECDKDHLNRTLTQVNDCVVRLGILKGDFHWHKHDNEDEFFFVVDGRFTLDVEGRDSVDLGPKQGFTVPRGVMHRPRAPEGVVLLMVEGAGVVPTGD